MATKDGKKTGGRKKGVPNKRSVASVRQVEEIFKKHNFEPLSEVIKIVKKPLPKPEDFDGFEEFVQAIKGTLTDKERADICLRLCKFLYPEKKSVELGDLTDSDGNRPTLVIARAEIK